MASDAPTDSGLPAQSATIGSESWIGADAYESDDEINAQIVKFFNTVKWEKLASIAMSHRSGTKCSYGDKYSVGQFNMVRRLNFHDGVSWAVRIRLPPEATPVPLEWYDGRRAFEAEVASMKFFKSKSTIPVPEVYVYNADPTNEVGAPYMLIEYIHGTAATELREIMESEPSMFGNASQDQNFREQMAKIHAETLSFKFQQIGSLYWSAETSEFFIGPDVDTGKGPWDSSTDYYRDLANELIKRAATRGKKNIRDSPSFSLPVLSSHLISVYGEEPTGPFRLVNRDFGAHNILVDDDFNIVGVVDFDAVGPAPLEVAAQYPELSGMDVEPPGAVETNPYALERIARTRPILDSYKQLLAKYEAELGDVSASVAGRLGSSAALAYQGMLNYAQMAMKENERWFASALDVLREYAKA